ncbi:MAG: hypothetical protein JWN25_287 [Verrucomicrobiales bacterium]|nr:hypothetical protein [Verrucomicrobiales bacterium]
MLTDLEKEILGALEELDISVMAIREKKEKVNLLPIFTRLEELTGALPKGTSPDLLHYLHKKSYEKAQFWLKGRDAENRAGNCGH